MLVTGLYLEPSQTPLIDRLAKSSILDVRLASEYTPVFNIFVQTSSRKHESHITNLKTIIKGNTNKSK